MLPDKVKDIIIIAAAILAVFIFVLWCASPAQAQGCSSVEEGSAKLKKNYGETPVFRGVSASGYMIVIFLNPETGSWTVGRIMPQNRKVMCPLDAGGDGSLRIDSIMQEDKKVEQKW
tara:strand:- start:7514 stop:7864 length:351 start_codon:yes stop_codon:yes gene_type:complete